MVLTIAGGPIGRGVHMQLPICMKDGVRDIMYAEEDGKYMGHKKIEWREIDLHRN
jgi:hypothetical protein